MSYLHLKFRKDNPNRPVDWRWLLADYILDKADGKISDVVKDSDILKAVTFKYHLNNCRSDKDYLYLLETDPAAYEAWNLVQQDEHSLCRYELEARLLAKEAFPEIARKLCVSEATIHVYESWFYNVLDRIYSPGYITHQAFRRSIQEGLSSRHYDCLWKMFGYWGGPVLLDAIIYQFNQPTPVGNTSGLKAALDDDLSTILRIKATVAAHTAPVTWETQMELMDKYIELRKIEQGSDSGGAASTHGTILANLAAFADQLPWHKTDPTKAILDDSRVERLRLGGVSLRSQELLMASSGSLPQNTIEVLATARFPEKEVVHE